jgi:hypothetical protein|tara:strand:- start:481 stop:780 length:300 start_codon:yes stop_codon:yes gene_type:complete
MKINQDNLPIKYIMGIEKDLPEYPTGFDILYNEIQLCVRMPDRHKGNFTLHALKTYRFQETEESKLLESIADLIDLGIVEPVNTEENKLSWKIIQNPFA